jgi:hypothetical protein
MHNQLHDAAGSREKGMSRREETEGLLAQIKALKLDLTTVKGALQAEAPRLEARLRSIEETLLSLQAMHGKPGGRKH